MSPEKARGLAVGTLGYGYLWGRLIIYATVTGLLRAAGRPVSDVHLDRWAEGQAARERRLNEYLDR